MIDLRSCHSGVLGARLISAVENIGGGMSSSGRLLAFMMMIGYRVLFHPDQIDNESLS